MMDKKSGRVGSRFPGVASQNLEPRATLRCGQINDFSENRQRGGRVGNISDTYKSSAIADKPSTLEYDDVVLSRAALWRMTAIYWPDFVTYPFPI